MAVFVDLDEETEPPQPHGYHSYHGFQPHPYPGVEGEQIKQLPASPSFTNKPDAVSNSNGSPMPSPMSGVDPSSSHQPQAALEDLNQSAMTEALGCYPIVMAIASSLDLNSLDNLSRTCHKLRRCLLQYHDALITHTLHCENEDVPVDPEDTFRYRARAGNWFYMEDGRSDHPGKSGSCARDMVAECRRCARVVCRNCAIKPPAPKVLRDRHRRLCITCSKAPLATLARPSLRLDTPVDADEMRRSMCMCASEGVWLCQPCGRSIRGADHEYQSIWKWRSQYGDVIGGVGTGIGEGDRGVICGRGEACCAARERQQETDCDAEDAREVDMLLNGGSGGGGSTGSATPPSRMYSASVGSTSSSNLSRSPSSRSRTPETTGLGTGSAGANAGASSTAHTNNGAHHPWLPPLSSSPELTLLRRVTGTPTPTTTPGGLAIAAGPARPGYARQEIEGIGGVVKTKLVRIVRVGACVPEWEDERHGAGGLVLGREVSGRARSWCGWCWRVIPGKRDLEGGHQHQQDELQHRNHHKRGKRSADVAALGDGDGNGKDKWKGKGKGSFDMDLPMR